MKILIACAFCFSFAVTANSVYQQTADHTYRTLPNSISFQVIPSTYPLNWNSSRGLLFSLAKNQYFFPKSEMILGHITTELNCTVNGNKQREFIGASPKDLMGFRDIIMEGYGFSVLNRPGLYTDIPLLKIEGELDDEAEDFQLFDEMIAKNNLAVLSYALDEKNCAEALQFVREYKMKAAGGTSYGFGVSPEKFEGAGCAPMAESVMKKAGLVDLAKKFERTLYVPLKLLGDPEKKKKVRVWDLMTDSSDLTRAQRGFLRFEFPDPQLIYDYVNSTQQDGDRPVERVPFSGSHSILMLVR